MKRKTVVLGVAVLAAGMLAAGWVWHSAQPAAGGRAAGVAVTAPQAPPDSPVMSGAPPAAAVQVPAARPTPTTERRADGDPPTGTRRAEGSRTATPRAEREPRSLVALVQPLWSELTPEQQFVLAPFGEQWNTWPQAEKRAWVKLADRVPRMSAERQAKAHERIREWAALSPEQRRLARSNYRLAKKLPHEARVAQWQHYETLTDEQKDVLRSAGSTSNTAAGHAGARTALAKEAAQPIVPAPVQ